MNCCILVGEATYWNQIKIIQKIELETDVDRRFVAPLCCSHSSHVDTPDDIRFLRSRIAGRGPRDPKLAQKRFRNVSIITARNTQKDRINQLGCERFAAENNLTLTSFYSIDRWRDPDEAKKKRAPGRPKKTMLDPVRQTNIYIATASTKGFMGAAT